MHYAAFRHRIHLQLLAPGALGGHVLARGGEAGKGDAGVDVWGRLHPETSSSHALIVTAR